jgi:hypothetical protein
MFPQTQFLLFFVVPMPAWLFAGGIFGVSPLLLHPFYYIYREGPQDNG